jgi:hypothetical protein
VDFKIKQGDTSPVLTDTFTYTDGSSPNLAGATVKFVMRALTATSTAVNAAATITSNTNPATVSYTFTAQDTAVAGQYVASWLVTFSGGATMTFPTEGYLELLVEENLTTPGGARLVSLGEVKDHLRFSDNNRTRDARLMKMIDAVAPVVENITGPIIQHVYQNETYDGGSWFIALRHRPVLSVSEVTEYRGPIAYPLTQVSTPRDGTIYSYMFEPPGRIVRRTVGGGITPFPPGADQVFVTYMAGYTSTPANVREGVLELIRINYDQTEQPGPANDQDRFGATILGFFVPNRVRELLSPNKRHPILA